jgi:hypothetical protein
MDDKTTIMHLRLAIVGGAVIVAAGLLSLLRYNHIPFLSFAIGPLISFTAWRSLREVQRRRNFAQIRVRPGFSRRGRS